MNLSSLTSTFRLRSLILFLLAGVKKLYALTGDELAALGQKRLPSEARMLAAWAVREMSDSTLAELAKKLGRDASAMSAAAARFDRRRKQERRMIFLQRQKNFGKSLRFHSFMPRPEIRPKLVPLDL